MSTTGDTTRHLGTVYRGAECWDWAALYRGHVQPRGYRTYWRGCRFWQLHLTPVHLHRDGQKWEAGVCWGRRTLYIKRHR